MVEEERAEDEGVAVVCVSSAAAEAKEPFEGRVQAQKEEEQEEEQEEEEEKLAGEAKHSRGTEKGEESDVEGKDEKE